MISVGSALRRGSMAAARVAERVRGMRNPTLDPDSLVSTCAREPGSACEMAAAARACTAVRRSERRALSLAAAVRGRTRL